MKEKFEIRSPKSEVGTKATETTRRLELRRRAFRFITAERERQEELLAAGKFPFTCADPLPEAGGDHALKLAILTEEVGEVAKEVFELSVYESNAAEPTAKLRTELVQVAAVAVAWLEALISEMDGED